MNAERWKQVDDLLQSALAVRPEQRDEFLRQACAGDAELIDEVKSLLTSHRRAGDFLKGPAIDVAARSVAVSEVQIQPSFADERIPHYRILKQLGSGGMGSVWLAERSDDRFDRQVAIKFINLSAMGQGTTNRFMREGSILGRLTHPHIAELMDAGVTANTEPYLVLEYVEGRPVDEYCDEHMLAVEARIRLFLDVLSAVSHAHANLVVHRDIKPSNVLVNSDGQVKLLDFGIAKLLADAASPADATALTLEGGGILTPRFAAPEQVTGASVTTATDVYALGVLLYLLLTGRHPAGNGSSPAQLLKAITENESLDPSEAVLADDAKLAEKRATTADKLRRQLRGDLDTIVGKALKKNPAERYTTVSAFADDLQRYLKREPISARPDTISYRAGKFVRRNRVAVVLAAVAIAAVIAGAAAAIVQAQTARKQRDFAFRELARAEQMNDLNYVLLTDVAPSAKPLNANELLERAEQIVERENYAGRAAGHVELLISIGTQYFDRY
jgi:serine/threonine protein kinase